MLDPHLIFGGQKILEGIGSFSSGRNLARGAGGSVHRGNGGGHDQRAVGIGNRSGDCAGGVLGVRGTKADQRAEKRGAKGSRNQSGHGMTLLDVFLGADSLQVECDYLAPEERFAPVYY